MEITQFIRDNWNSESGLAFFAEKGKIKRFIRIPANNKWDVWGYVANSKADSPKVVIRGNGRTASNTDSVIEKNKFLKISVIDYLKDFVVTEKL